jgi:aldehyde dehydrogenase (NAD+)
MTKDCTKFYIGGQWLEASDRPRAQVINPATEEPCAAVALGNADDIDDAVRVARAAFDAWSQTSTAERVELLQRITAGIKSRGDELAGAVSAEMGCPIRVAKTTQLLSGLAHFTAAGRILDDYTFAEARGNTLVVREPVGVCGLITPWNWPLNQIACKVAPALAAGCTVVLKPSEVAPLSAYILTEIIAAAFEESGMPAGVFNLVNGDGPVAGAALAAHPQVDLISFTGSTRAGKQVAKTAADTIKRVTLELGGKSANIILDDADFPRAVSGGLNACWINSGQSCNAPSRLLVPKQRMAEAAEIARAAAAKLPVGDPADRNTRLGPVANKQQYDKVQGLIEQGLEAGATLIVGGTGRPTDFDKGYYIKPTVFADVSNDMAIAREEIFGPVLVIIPYEDEDDAVRLANDTDYGLSGYVSGDPERARRLARRLRSGMVHLNGAGLDFAAPFGGYKQSGNGREWGVEGFEEFLETKSIFGHGPT